MSILAIDPGCEKSGYVVLADDDSIVEHGVVQHPVMLEFISDWRDRMAIEMIASYGMPVGREIFETVFFIGRYAQAYYLPEQVVRIPRKAVTRFICNNASASDANIRQALIDRYPRTGGGAIPQIGVKAAKGPLFGMAKDRWAALALAFTAREHWAEGLG